MMNTEQLQPEILRRKLVFFPGTGHVHCFSSFFSYPHRPLLALVALLVLLREILFPGDDCACSFVATELLYSVTSFLSLVGREVLHQRCQLLSYLVASKAFRSTCPINIVLFYMLHVAKRAINFKYWDNLLGQPRWTPNFFQLICQMSLRMVVVVL